MSTIPDTPARPRALRALRPLSVLALGLAVLGGVATPTVASASPAPPVAAPGVTAAVASDNPIVRYAEDIANGDAETGWGGGSVPYAWGGGHAGGVGPSLGTCAGYTGPAPCRADVTRGTDCSGFTRWVYDLAYGEDVLGAGNTNNQIAEMTSVGAANAQPGDLVFYGTSSTNTHHVGVYIGGGEMIDALETGTNVREDSVSVGSDIVGYYHLNKPLPTQVTTYTASSSTVQFGQQVETFGRTTTGTTEADVYTPGKGWSGWTSLGGTLADDPTAVQYGTQLQVFGRAANGHTYSDVWTPNTGWSGWTDLGGVIASDPVAIQYGNQMQV
ncbi:MAG TPA: NlpC/P60 family protein, partial [Pseudonocardiaceae bacterium]|nr:NlpC/P60 family protein [Pseudonocardiaceae bacterium]